MCECGFGCVGAAAVVSVRWQGCRVARLQGCLILHRFLLTDGSYHRRSGLETCSGGSWSGDQ